MNNRTVKVDSRDGAGDGSVERTHDSHVMNRQKIICDSIMNVISAVRKGHCWFLDAWLNCIPVDFLVDPGAVVSAISYEFYELLHSNTGCSLRSSPLADKFSAANDQPLNIYGACDVHLDILDYSFDCELLVCDLNVLALLGTDILGIQLPFLFDMKNGLLSAPNATSIPLHRSNVSSVNMVFSVSSIAIPPRSEVVIQGRLRTQSGRHGPSTGVIQCLKEFVDVYNIMVGRSVVNAYRWDVPVLLVNSADHVVTIPAWTAIGQVESVAGIRKINNVGASPRSQPNVLPDHVELLVSDATELSDVENNRLRLSLSSYVALFPTPGSPLMGRTTAITHDIDTGSTKPIRCSPRRLSPKKIEIQSRLVEDMLRDGQIEPSDSPWSAPTLLITKKDGSTRFAWTTGL